MMKDIKLDKWEVYREKNQIFSSKGLAKSNKDTLKLLIKI